MSRLLPNLQFFKERSRNRCAMTEQFPVILNLFQDLITQKLEGRKSFIKKFRGSDARRSGCFRRSEPANKLLLCEAPITACLPGFLTSVSYYSLSSNPPTLLSSNNHSGGNASLIPPYELRTVIMKDGWEIKDDYPC